MNTFARCTLLALSLPLTLTSWSQSAPVAPRVTLTEVIPLKNITTQSDQNEVLTAARNMAPAGTRIFLVQSQSTIAVTGTAEDIALVRKLVSELDLPRYVYRLNYTVNTFDGTKKIGSQHYSMVVVSGQHATMKQGSRIPIAVGSPGGTNGSAHTEIQYIDVGMNFDATLDEFSNGVRLRSRVEQSSVAPEIASAATADPVIRQTTAEGTSVLSLGKPLLIASSAVAGSTQHVEIEVTAEQLR